MITTRSGLRIHVFGYESDIERTDVLYTSVLIQMWHGLVAARVPDRASPRSWRRSWLLGFAAAVTGRVRAAEDAARSRADQAASPSPAAARRALAASEPGRPSDRRGSARTGTGLNGGPDPAIATAKPAPALNGRCRRRGASSGRPGCNGRASPGLCQDRPQPERRGRLQHRRGEVGTCPERAVPPGRVRRRLPLRHRQGGDRMLVKPGPVRLRRQRYAQERTWAWAIRAPGRGWWSW